MTVVTRTNIEKLQIFANKKDYTFDIKIFPIINTKDDLKVSIQESQFVIIPQVEDVDYNITLFHPQAEGGTITFVPSKILKDNTTLIIERILPLNQNISFPPNSEFIEKNIEDGLDLGIMIDQQLQAEIDDLETRVLPIDEIKELVHEAKEAEAGAKDAETAAKDAEAGAKSAETAAENSATEASQSEIDAKAAADKASQSEIDAKAAADQASQSEIDAKAAADQASQSEIDAKAAADQASQSEIDAKAAADQAAASASTINLPDLKTATPGQGIIVKPDLSGYQFEDLLSYKKYIVETNPDATFPNINTKYQINLQNFLQEGLFEEQSFIYFNSRLTNEADFVIPDVRLSFYKLFFSEFMGFAYSSSSPFTDLLGQINSEARSSGTLQLIKDPTKFYLLKPVKTFQLQSLRFFGYATFVDYTQLIFQIKFYDSNKSEIYDSGRINFSSADQRHWVAIIDNINSNFDQDSEYYLTLYVQYTTSLTPTTGHSFLPYFHSSIIKINPAMASSFDAKINLSYKDLLYQPLDLDYSFVQKRQFIESELWKADNLASTTRVVTDTFDKTDVYIDSMKISVLPYGSCKVTFYDDYGTHSFDLYPALKYPDSEVKQSFRGLNKIEYTFSDWSNQVIIGNRESNVKEAIFNRSSLHIELSNPLFDVAYQVESSNNIPLTFTTVPLAIADGVKIISFLLILESFHKNLDINLELFDKDDNQLTLIKRDTFLITSTKHLYGFRYLNIAVNKSIKIKFTQNDKNKIHIYLIYMYSF